MFTRQAHQATLWPAAAPSPLPLPSPPFPWVGARTHADPSSLTPLQHPSHQAQEPNSLSGWVRHPKKPSACRGGCATLKTQEPVGVGACHQAGAPRPLLPLRPQPLKGAHTHPAPLPPLPLQPALLPPHSFEVCAALLLLLLLPPLLLLTASCSVTTARSTVMSSILPPMYANPAYKHTRAHDQAQGRQVRDRSRRAHHQVRAVPCSTGQKQAPSVSHAAACATLPMLPNPCPSCPTPTPAAQPVFFFRFGTLNDLLLSGNKS